ncbi:MAG: pseudouridylate synthase [Bacteroidales bacterium]|nr:pseudouridylate synthase [Candidatus Liminaster caballi]
MDYRSIDIREILPQGEAFRMVDRLCEWSLEHTVTEFEVKADNYFVGDGRFSVSGLTENIAQTSAARIGYYHKYVLHTPVSIGFIGAVQGLKVMRLPEVGERLTTSIDVTAEAFGMVSFDAEIRDADGQPIATGRMKTAE